MNSGIYSEAAVAERYEWSLREFGAEHTHAFACPTWRGRNWAGACDCGLNGEVSS